MSKKRPTNIPASVRNKLHAHASEKGEDHTYVLARFALERFLYRLGESPHRALFVLKGAMLFPLWGGERHRPTKDLDLLSWGEVDVARFEQIVREVCQVPCEDGLAFDLDTVRGEMRREDDLYEGLHVDLEAELAGARISLQIDIGFGDVVTPGPVDVEYPTILDQPAPRLRAYPRETVVAEKFQAMVALGMRNSRMKDFFDVHDLARRFEFAGPPLSAAISATFGRRQTPVPETAPDALSATFSADPSKRTQWQAFRKRGKLEAAGSSLDDVVAFLSTFLVPPADAARQGVAFPSAWPPGGPWQPAG